MGAPVQRSDYKLKRKMEGPKGIGGWLFVMISLLVGVSIIQLNLMMNEYSTFIQWFWVIDSNAFRSGLMIRLVADFFLLLFAGITVFLYTRRSFRFPDAYNLWSVTLFLTSCAMDVCFFYDNAVMPALSYPPFFATCCSFILLAITLPYFITSRRVRNTFTVLGNYAGSYS